MARKNVPLRLTEQLYQDIAAWAEDDFRSVNGQIEYLLTECVKQRKKNGKYVGQEIDAPPKFSIQSFGREDPIDPTEKLRELLGDPTYPNYAEYDTEDGQEEE